jgi:hypothetical protein
MKKFLFLLLFANTLLTSFAQNDSITITIDTVNFRGIVVNENGNPIENLKIKTLHSRRSTTTNSEGLFYFQSLPASDRIIIETGDRIIWENVSGSRFIRFKIAPPPVHNINTRGYGFKQYQVESKRIVPKPSMKVKKETKTYSFDEDGHFFPPNYAGGIDKFYNHLIQNIKYPTDAIANNVEGLVKISFTIKKYGGIKDIQIIRDIGFGCAEEVIRVLTMTAKKWNAGSNVTLFEQTTVFEVPFKLTD